MTKKRPAAPAKKPAPRASTSAPTKGAKKAAAKKAAAKKATAKKATAKKATAKKAAAKKTAGKKTAAKKTAAKTASAKKTAAKKTAAKKTAAKKTSAKKIAAKKTAAKKAAAKKAAAKKAAAKKTTAKKTTAKKAAAKKTTAKKTTAKKTAADETTAKKAVAKKASGEKAAGSPPAEAPSPTSADSAATNGPGPATAAPKSPDRQEKSSVSAPQTPSSRVIRRRPAAASSANPSDPTPVKRGDVIRVAAGERTPNRGGKRRPGKSPVMELNPRLESSRHVLPKAQGHVPGGRPVSFAERVRAEAEAAFQKIAPKWKGDEVPAEAAPAPSPAPQLHRSSFEIRISEQDSLTTKLRVSTGKAALDAAQELATRYRLPPDQGLLLKVIQLKNTELTRLALEEMLELDDRGRIRANPELIDTLRGIKSRDREIKELRELFLEKLGAA